MSRKWIVRLARFVRVHKSNWHKQQMSSKSKWATKFQLVGRRGQHFMCQIGGYQWNGFSPQWTIKKTDCLQHCQSYLKVHLSLPLNFDPRGQPQPRQVVTISFHTVCPAVCPKLSKPSKNHCRPGRDCGLAEWIIDDSSQFIPLSFPVDPLAIFCHSPPKSSGRIKRKFSQHKIHIGLLLSQVENRLDLFSF